MMKSTLTSLITAVLITCSAGVANATNFYICSGTEFILQPSAATFDGYRWIIDGDAAGAITTTNLTHTFTLAGGATAYADHTIEFQVLDNGCWSTEETHIVYVLPELTIDVASPDGTEFCGITDLEDLTATIGTVTLPVAGTTGETGDITTAINWTGDGGTGTGATFAITAFGTYTATVSYSFPVSYAGRTKTNDCNASDNITIIENNTLTPDAPAVELVDAD